MPRWVDRAIEAAAVRVAALTVGCLRHPAWTLLVASGAIAWLLVGALRLEQVSSIAGFLPQGDPQLERYRDFVNEFSSDEIIFVAVSCSGTSVCESIFEPRVVRALGGLEERLGGIAWVERIVGPLSVPLLEGRAGTLRLRRLDEIDPDDAQALRTFGERMREDARLRGAFVSEDAATGGIVLRLPKRVLSEAEQEAVVTTVIDASERFRAETGMVSYVVGVTVTTTLMNQRTREDLRRLTPLMFGLVMLIFVWTFRSFAAGLAPLVAVGVATLAAFGTMGHTGAPITLISGVLPILIVVIGVTDAMHLMTRYFHYADADRTAPDALATAARELGVPTLVTALTSSAGLLSFTLSPMPHMRQFGIFAAIGILSAFLATFTLLPVLVSLLAPRARPRPGIEIGHRLLRSIAVQTTRHSGALVAALVVAAACSAVAMSGLRVQQAWLEGIDESDYLHRSHVFVNEHMRPATTLEVMINGGSDGALLTARGLEQLEAIETALLRHESIRRVDSVLPLLREVRAELGDGAPGERSLPTRSSEISEILFLLRSSAPEVLEEFVSLDERLVRLSAALRFSNSSDDVALLEQVYADTSAIVSPERVMVTGSYSINARLAELILDTQIASFTGAFVTIFAVLALFVGSLRYAALGMIPNVFPIAATLGLMGVWGVRLDMGTAMIASILIGISVDDTVYFLMHYRTARRRGLEIPESVRYTFAFSGNAAMFSTVILAAGFSLLVLSRFQSLAYFGLLSAFAVLLAIVSELFFLPAVLSAADGLQRWAAGGLA